MSILSGLTPPDHNVCYVLKQSAELSKEDKAILLEAIDNPQWSITALSTELKRRGLTLSRGTLDRHRKRLCSCNA